MTTTPTTSSTPPASIGANFSTITPAAFKLAAQFGMEIIGCSKGFNTWKDGDILSADCTSAEIEQWLEGYASGKDEAAAPAVLHELLMAELIIITILNALTPEQKLAVHAQLAATGIAGTTATRSSERRAAITAAGAA